MDASELMRGTGGGPGALATNVVTVPIGDYEPDKVGTEPGAILKGPGVRVQGPKTTFQEIISASKAEVGMQIAKNIGEAADHLRKLNEENVREAKEKERIQEERQNEDENAVRTEALIDAANLSDEIVRRQEPKV